MLKNWECVEKIKGVVMVSLENIGEGNCGDFDPKDPEDENLLRFTIYRKNGREFEELDDASYCTQLPATITKKQVKKALNYLMMEFNEPVREGHSVKKLGERLSWISIKDLK